MFGISTFGVHTSGQKMDGRGDRLPVAPGLLAVLMISLFMVGSVNAEPAAKEEHWCLKVATELKQKRQRLQEYRKALQTALAGNDSPLSEALKHKIKQVTEEVRILDQENADCAAHDPRDMAQGLRSAKTEESKYATKTCAELKKLVFPLLVRERALKRKEKSLLSALTPEEEAELSACSDQLRVLGQLLRTRCSAPRSRGSLLKKLRP